MVLENWHGLVLDAGMVEILKTLDKDMTNHRARGLYVRPDGLKFYIAGQNRDRIYEYNISTATPWNIDTVGYHTRQNMSQMTYSNFGIDIYGNSKTGLGTTTAYLYNIGIHDVQGVELLQTA